MQESRISVIVPIYNAEQWLRRCVDSILAQTFTDFELLLIDDGSKDGSGAICDEYALRDSRVRVFHKPNGGVSSARNLGLDNASGQWITFVDADDWIDMNFLKAISNHSEDLVVGDYSLCNISDSWMNRHVPAGFYDYVGIRWLLTNFTSPIFCTPWSKLFKKSIIDGYNIRFNQILQRGEDTIFVYNYVLYCENIYCTDQACYNYRFSYTGLSQKYDFESTSEFAGELNRAADKINQKYGIMAGDFIHNYIRGNISSLFPNDLYRQSHKSLKKILSRIRCDNEISKILNTCSNRYSGKRSAIFFWLYSQNRSWLIFSWLKFCHLIGKCFV